MHALIEARIQNLIARAESEGDYIGWYECYADDSGPEGGIYVANWNGSNRWWHRNLPNTVKILGDLIEEHTDAALDWEDTTIGCGECNKLIDTDDYYKRTFHVWDGDVSCAACIEADPGPYLDDCAERGEIADIDVDPEDAEWIHCESPDVWNVRDWAERAAKRVKNGYRAVIDGHDRLWIKRD